VHKIRRLLIVTFLFGALGTGAELLLIGHFEEIFQLVPLALLGFSIVVAIWHLMVPGAASLRTFQMTMALLLAGGIVGIGLHYNGNETLQRETHPSLGGIELVRRTMTGEAPVLAPGTLTLLGLIGLVQTYKHPLLHADLADLGGEGEQ
jgi:hypothetical protein